MSTKADHEADREEDTDEAQGGCLRGLVRPSSCLPRRLRSQRGLGKEGRKGAERSPSSSNVSSSDGSPTTSTEHYGDGVAYWDARYTKESCASFDWYQRYKALKPIIDKHIPDKRARILVVGCGTSDLSEDMVADEYTAEVVNIDISPVCIDYMREKHMHVQSMSYHVQDVRHMTFPDGHFDAVIDKGTLDTLMCEADGWDSVRQMLLGIDRVLKPGGVLVEVTYGEPMRRSKWLELPPTWETAIYIIDKPAPKGTPKQHTAKHASTIRQVTTEEASALGEVSNVHFAYVCTKGSIKRNSTHQGVWVATSNKQ